MTSITNRRLPTAVGLVAALAGPASPALFEPSADLTTQFLWQLALWALLLALLVIVHFWERKPLSSIGLRWHRSSVAWGLSLFAAQYVLNAVLFFWLSDTEIIAGFRSGFDKLSGLPPWLLLWAALTAGVVEEVLYRGYAIERLAPWLGSYGRAGALALAVFALAHLPFWGAGPALFIFVAGVLNTLFYIWKRDLPACMIAHAATDAIGLLTLVRST